MGLPLLFIGTGVFSRAAPRGRTSFPDSFTHRGGGTPTYLHAVKTVAGGAETTTTASTTFFFFIPHLLSLFILTTFLSSCRFSSPSLRSFYEFESRSAVSEPIQRLDERKEGEMVVQARFSFAFLNSDRSESEERPVSCGPKKRENSRCSLYDLRAKKIQPTDHCEMHAHSSERLGESPAPRCLPSNTYVSLVASSPAPRLRAVVPFESVLSFSLFYFSTRCRTNLSVSDRMKPEVTI